MATARGKYSDGADAADLIADMGMRLFPWETSVLEDWCARDEQDRPAFVTCGLSVPRQNGKNAILEAFEFYMLAVCGAHILHTAHRVKTAKKSFQRLVKYFTDKRHEEVCALVSKVRYTNGEEAILLTNGGSIEFSARSHAGSRGFDDIQVVVFDEAQDLTDDQLSAIMYTLAASSTGDRQMIFTGTPPDDASPGTVFARNRTNAIGPNPPKRSLWYEWGVEKLPPRGSTFADVLDLVYECNPSMGYTLDEEFTEAEFANASIEGFATERLGWWSPASREAAAIPKKVWEDAEIDAIGNSYRKKRALGVKFSPDGSEYALAGCKTDSKGNAAVELVEVGSTASGLQALAEALMKRMGTTSCVVVDGQSGASALCDRLSDLKPPRGYIVRPKTSDVIAASTGFVESLSADKVRHTSQPMLDDSALHSVRRPIGNRGGWGFGSTEGHDSTPVEAASLALWGVRNTRRDPKRKQVML